MRKLLVAAAVSLAVAPSLRADDDPAEAFTHDVIARSGAVWTEIRPWTAVNARGTVAFIARSPGETGTVENAYTVSPNGELATLIPTDRTPTIDGAIVPNQRLGDGIRIDSSDRVSFRRRLHGKGTVLLTPTELVVTYFERWTPWFAGGGAPEQLAFGYGGGTQAAAFDALDEPDWARTEPTPFLMDSPWSGLFGHSDVNDLGKPVIWALLGADGSSQLATKQAPGVTPQWIGATATGERHPSLANTGEWTVRSTGGSILYLSYDFSTITTIAGPAQGFSGLGMCPAISPNGDWISFAGTQGGRPGVFLHSTRGLTAGQPIRIAGPAGDGVLDPGETWNDDGDESLEPGEDEGPHVSFLVDGNHGVTDDGTVVFQAVGTGGEQEIWSARTTVTAGAAAPGRRDVVARTGSTLGGVAPAPLASLAIYDPVAGTGDSLRIAFWATTADGTTLVVRSRAGEMDLFDANAAYLPDPLPLVGAIDSVTAGEVFDGLALLDGYSLARKVRRAATDGVTLVLLRARLQDDADLETSVRVDALADDGLAPGSLHALTDATLVDDSEHGGARDGAAAGDDFLSTSVYPGIEGNYVFALYRTPRDFGPSTGPYRDVALRLTYTAIGGGQRTMETSIRLVRPLVLLVHGTWDTPDGWNGCPLWSEGGRSSAGYGAPDGARYARFAVDRLALDDPAGRRGPNSANLLASTHNALERWRLGTGTAATQADFVTHSFGGPCTRGMQLVQATVPSELRRGAATSFRCLENWGHGPIRKLIAISGTHRGSATGHHAAFLNQHGVKRGAVGDEAEDAHTPLGRGAVADQFVGSAATRALPPAIFPCHAIVGSGDARWHPEYAERVHLLGCADSAVTTSGTPGDYSRLLFPPDGTTVATCYFQWTPTAERIGVAFDYVFNLEVPGEFDHPRLTPADRDDPQLVPNHDLTVSSWSCRGGLDAAACSDATHPDFQGLAGRLTHSTEISIPASFGAGELADSARQCVEAVARRVANLLDAPIPPDYATATGDAFGRFTQMTTLTRTETELANTTVFNPAWLTLGGSGDGGPAKKGGRPRRDPPRVTVDPVSGAFTPGSVVRVSVDWPGHVVRRVIVRLPSPTPLDRFTWRLPEGETSADVTLPALRAGTWRVRAEVVDDADQFDAASAPIVVAPPEAPVSLRLEPAALDLGARTRVPVRLYGIGTSGAEFDLTGSPAVTWTVADGLADATAGHVTARRPGTGSLVVSLTDGPTASAPLTVRALTLRAAYTGKKKKVELVLFGAADVDPSKFRKDGVFVSVDGAAPVAVKVQTAKKDADRDGRKDAIVRVTGLVAPPPGASLTLTGALPDGTFVTAIAVVPAR